MLYSHMDQKIAEARIDALIEEAKERRQSRKVSQKRTFSLPELKTLFANRNSEQNTAVATQA